MADRRVALRAKKKQLLRRKKHGRKRLYGSADRPRLVVYRSNRHIYVQLVNDIDRRTITGCSTLTPVLLDKLAKFSSKIEQAKLVGENISVLAKEKGISCIAFDRNGRKYHGRLKALADAVRAGGLDF
ncbi:50S ribosomal protein L18 [bacterium]|nr:50S ribosomal protein L18 [bacterium]